MEIMSVTYRGAPNAELEKNICKSLIDNIKPINEYSFERKQNCELITITLLDNHG